MDRTKEEKFKIKGAGRFLNWRPIVAISLSFGLGIFLCYKISFFAFIVGFVLAVIGGVVSAISAYKDKNKILKRIVICVLLLIFFLAGGISFNARVAVYEKDTVEEGRYSISAIVKDIKTTDTLVLKDVMITDGDDVISLNSNIVLYVYYLPENIGIGSSISFVANLKRYDLNAYGKFNANNILENIKYYASISGSAISINGEAKFNLFYFLREKIRNVLFDNMSTRNAALSYAMMTGDESFVESNLLQNFRYGGIAHIFAVSGLHISVIYGALYFVLKRIRMSWFVRSLIIFTLLLTYSGVCAFSPSSVRALIMCTVLNGITSAGLKYDTLNSFSIACLVVLIINPVYLFTAGFQLSVAAVFGITCLAGVVTCTLAKIKCPKKLAGAIGVSFSAQIATFPLLLDLFGYVPALSLLINIIFVPIISVVFTLLIFTTFFACIMPFAASILLYIPELILNIVVFPLEVIDLNILLISGFTIGAFKIIWYLIIIIVSDKINLRACFKMALCIVLCVAMVLGICFSNGGFVKENDVFISGGYNHGIVYVKSEKDLLISYGVPKRDEVENFALKNKIYDVDGLIILGSEKEINVAVPIFLSEIGANKLYVTENADYLSSLRTIDVVVQNGTFNCGDATLTFVNYNVLKIVIDDNEYLLVNNSNEAFLGSSDADVLIAFSYDDTFTIDDLRKCVLFEDSKDYLSVRRLGNLRIRAKNGIISVSRRGVL